MSLVTPAGIVARMLRCRGVLVVCWCVLVAVSALFALQLTDVVTGASSGVPGSGSVETIERSVRNGLPAGTFFPFLVLVESDGLSVHDARFEAHARKVADALVAVPGGGVVRSYWNTGRADLLGKGRHTALILFRSNVASFNEAEGLTRDLRKAVSALGLPGDFRVLVTGTPAMYFDLDRQSSADLLRAERVGLPITLLILLMTFGAPVAACLPILLALAAVVVSAAALFLLSDAMPVSVFAGNVVSMIGLGVGVDYGLFVITSFRRALADGLNPAAAAAAAVHDAGHTVVVSALAVVTGFAALFLVNVPALHSMAVGGICVVLTASLAALTLLPAALSWLGNTVNWPRKRTSRPANGGIWDRWASRVMGRPWTCLLAGLAILALFVAPVLRLERWNVGVENLTPELEAREGYEVLVRDFEAGAMGPTILSIEAPPGSTVWHPEFQRGVTFLSLRLLDDPRVATVNGFPDLLSVANSLRLSVDSSSALPPRLRELAADFVSPDGRTALIVVLPATTPESRESITLIEDLRRDMWPEFNGLHPRVGISGTAALTKDFDEEIFGRMRVVVPAVLGATFVVLLVSFRSVMIPLKAIALNLLSVLASYGFLVYVFQDGHGSAWIGLSPPGGLNSFVVVVLFTVLFGLSMDYEVFLLSSVKRAYALTNDNKRAVALGLQETAGPICSAALIMVSMFASFGFTRLVATRELGLGLAFAVALDATLIRLALVPASMALLGSLNWWLPPWPGRTPARGRPARPSLVP
jgi:putative drug exporter of the RND superfamily